MAADASNNPPGVIVRGGSAGFAQEIEIGSHRLKGDEPLAFGGTDTGPSPYDFLLAALGTCTSMTISLYARRKGFPQVIHSSKRFAGPTGLEEYVGRGVGMALTVYARDGALIFRSKDYFVQLFGRRFFLPAWLTPGTLYVTHAELPDGKFSFTLQIFHPRLGLLIRQMAMFRETAP